MEDLDTELLGQLQRWHEEDQYQRIIDAIEAIPQPERGYELTCQLARAYNNLAGPEEAGPLEKSVSLLESIADQGQEDPLWHYRLGYALFYLDREEEALPHFQRAAELDPQDPDAAEFIRQCQKYIAAKQCCPEVYGQEDWDTVDQHIHTYFGSSENVFHEIVSPDIHVDIYIIPPSPERMCHTCSCLEFIMNRDTINWILKKLNTGGRTWSIYQRKSTTTASATR